MGKWMVVAGAKRRAAERRRQRAEERGERCNGARPLGGGEPGGFPFGGGASGAQSGIDCRGSRLRHVTRHSEARQRPSTCPLATVDGIFLALPSRPLALLCLPCRRHGNRNGSRSGKQRTGTHRPPGWRRGPTGEATCPTRFAHWEPRITQPPPPPRPSSVMIPPKQGEETCPVMCDGALGCPHPLQPSALS